MAKKELKYTPLLGQFMTLSNAVFVNRSKRTDAVAVFAKVAETMKEKVVSLSLAVIAFSHLSNSYYTHRLMTTCIAGFSRYSAVTLHLPRRNTICFTDSNPSTFQERSLPSRRASSASYHSHRL